MVIDCKVLTKLMKAAYKDQGYTVGKSAGLDDEEAVLSIGSPNWAAEISWKNVPGPVLGLIAEHLKGLPGAGEAFQVKRRENTTILSEFMNAVPTKPTGDDRILAHRTPLTYSGLEVWQMDQNKKCFLMLPELAELLDDHGRLPIFTAGGVMLTGEATRVFVYACPEKDSGPEHDTLQYLSREWWR